MAKEQRKEITPELLTRLEGRVWWRLQQLQELHQQAARCSVEGWRLRGAEDRHKLAVIALRSSTDGYMRQQERAAQAERLQRLRAAPDLQALVVDCGGWDCIGGEAWRAFDAEMETWKARMRGGDLTGRREMKHAGRRQEQQPQQQQRQRSDWWKQRQR